MDGDGVEFYRRFQRFDFFEADAEFTRIVRGRLALLVDLVFIDGLIIPKSDQTVGPRRRDDSLRAIISIERLHDTLLAVII